MSLVHRVMRGRIRARASQFDRLPPAPGDIVFLGDSITDHGAWQDWFPGRPVRNRGISGDTTDGVLERLSSCLGPAPRAVFLLIGTNDLGFDVPPARIVANLERIVSGIRQRAPGAALFVQSVFPRRANLARKIRALNTEYRRIAAAHGATYVDLWPALADGERLRAEYTADQLHLNGAGYAAWVEVLRGYVEELG